MRCVSVVAQPLLPAAELVLVIEEVVAFKLREPEWRGQSCVRLRTRGCDFGQNWLYYRRFKSEE